MSTLTLSAAIFFLWSRKQGCSNYSHTFVDEYGLAFRRAETVEIGEDVMFMKFSM